MQNRGKEIAEAVDAFSHKKLKKKDDLERIISQSILSDQVPLLLETAFNAKYLQGIFSIIQRGESPVNEQVLMTYMQEYSGKVEIVKNNLRTIISGAGQFVNEIFEKKYFSLTQEGLNNLNDLCYDLGWYKMYTNDMKR